MQLLVLREVLCWEALQGFKGSLFVVTIVHKQFLKVELIPQSNSFLEGLVGGLVFLSHGLILLVFFIDVVNVLCQQFGFLLSLLFVGLDGP